MWLLHKHYAHRIPSVSYAFGLYDKENVLCGICTYGMPPLTNVKFICDRLEMNDILELNRLCIVDNHQKNLLSYFIGQTFKLLPQNIVLLSYADINQDHHGYVYQATNWIYTGLGSIGTKEYTLHNKQIHSRHLNKQEFFMNKKLFYNDKKTFDENFINIGGGIKKNLPKHRYIMFVGEKRFKKKMMKELKLPVLPYPKGDNKRYDTSYKPKTQGLLF